MFSKVKKSIRNTVSELSPTLSTKLLYKRYFHKRIDLRNPKTFNEKVCWLKLNTYFDNETVKICADKYRVRKYIKDKGLGELLIPLIGVVNNSEELLWDGLPNQFALKLNVGCGCNIICTDKSKLNCDDVKKQMDEWQNGKYYLRSAEYQYKDIPKRFIIEECLPVKNGNLPPDYKFYCANGKCEVIMLCTGREIGNGANFYFFDREWNLFKNSSIDYNFDSMEKPSLLNEAIRYAEKLAEGFPVVRVDLFLENDRIYFGELTFTPGAGLDTDFSYVPQGMNITLDEYLGKKVKL
ncbi:MAG: ATP-grasp fold amidoligase family protein [Eubacteriaceae bacterium]|nr:ATP-grasp fold amidoligase family protein [Eubacteriaceae bacterium]